MAAATTDKFLEAGAPGTATNLAPPGHTIGGLSLNVVSTTNWPIATAVIFAMDQVTTVNGETVRTPGTYRELLGIVTSATTIGSISFLYGADANFPSGANTRVYIPVASSWVNRLVSGLTQEHKQTGAHAAITADSLAATGAVSAAGGLSQTGGTFSLAGDWDGYIAITDTLVYVSATQFKIVGVNRTARYPVGTKIKLTQTSAKYFYVTAAAFGTDTTITVTAGSDYTLASAAITSPYLSYMETPQGFPDYFNFTPSWNNLTVGTGGNATNAGIFNMRGKTVTFRVTMIFGTAGLAMAAATLNAPVTGDSGYYATAVSTGHTIGQSIYLDTGLTEYPGALRFSSTSGNIIELRGWGAAATNVTAGASNNTSPFTFSVGDAILLHGSYKAA
jgi:hypothetical protein